MAESERTDYRSLGEILRDARKAQGKSVSDVAEMTKISPHAIAALEADDIDRLAGPVYARSFTRNLAEALGLDPEFLLTKLALNAPSAGKVELPQQEFPKSTGPITPRTQLPQSDEQKDASTWHIEKVRVTRVTAPSSGGLDRRIVAAGVVVGIALLLWLVILPRLRSGGSDLGNSALAGDSTQLAQNGSSPPIQAPIQPQDRTQQPDLLLPGGADPVPAEVESEEQDPIEREELVPASSIRPTRGPATSNPAGPSPAPTTQAEEEETPSEPAVVEKQPEVQPEVTIESREDRGLASIERPGGDDPAAAPRLTLVLRAERRVEVWAAADGRQRRRRILRRGDEWELEASDHFSLELEDASAVAVFFDGVRREAPAGLSGEWLLYPSDSQR